MDFVCGCGKVVSVLVGLLAALATILPLLQTDRCERPSFRGDVGMSPQEYVLGLRSPHGVVRFGEFFVLIVSGALSLIVVIMRDWRVDRRAQMHRWVRLFVVALVAQAIFAACSPGLYALCASSLATQTALFRLADRLCFLLHTWFLMHISIRRLRILGLPDASRQGLALMRATHVTGILSLLALAAHMHFDSDPAHTVFQVAFSLGAVSTAVIFVTFKCSTGRAFVRAVRDAREEALRRQGTFGTFKGARMIARMWAMSAMAMPVWLTMVVFQSFGKTSLTNAVVEVAFAINIIAGSGLALCTAGYIGPMGAPNAFHNLHAVLEERRNRQILETLRQAGKAVTGQACTVAALLEGMNEETLLKLAASRFRCVSWTVLKQHRHLVVDGASLDGRVAANDVYGISEPCKLAFCDAFWSHSWHDDGKLKWEALSAWCERFTQLHGRPPRLWFDRVCIDQTDIQNDLRCLPIFLAGCNVLLITCGNTYTSRLWCCTELFVYTCMLVDDESRGRPVIQVLGNSDEERTKVVEGWRRFDINHCDCFNAEDKTRILSVVEQHEGGALWLNAFIRRIGRSLRRADSGENFCQLSSLEIHGSVTPSTSRSTSVVSSNRSELESSDEQDPGQSHAQVSDGHGGELRDFAPVLASPQDRHVRSVVYV